MRGQIRRRVSDDGNAWTQRKSPMNTAGSYMATFAATLRSIRMTIEQHWEIILDNLSSVQTAAVLTIVIYSSYALI